MSRNISFFLKVKLKICFYLQSKSHNIFPIAGTNLITNKEDIILLVENKNGYGTKLACTSHKTFRPRRQQ